LAFINGHIVGVGDKIGAGLIVEVDQNSIKVKKGEREVTITLGQ